MSMAYDYNYNDEEDEDSSDDEQHDDDDDGIEVTKLSVGGQGNRLMLYCSLIAPTCSII